MDSFARRLFLRTPTVVRLARATYRSEMLLPYRHCAVSTTPHTHSNNQYRHDDEEARQHRIRLARLYSSGTGAAMALIFACYLVFTKFGAKADDGKKDEKESEEGEEEKAEPPKKEHVSFHDRKVMAYEDRIRAYSTPDKIFRYFATLKVIEVDGSRNVYMTPSDFMRSVTPNTMQPQEYGLDLYRLVNIQTVRKERLCRVENPDSIFNHLGQEGLISFSDYLFLLTILATPMKNFALAFKMFDLNGDGEVDVGEFETVRSVVRSNTSMGARHRDHIINGNVAGSVGGTLVDYFFGPKRDQKLTIEKFKVFHYQVNKEMLVMEFNRFKPVNDHITELNFAKFMLLHASLNEQKRKKIIIRMKKKFGNKFNPGISLEEVLQVDEIMQSLDDIDKALGLYYAGDASIGPDELRRACKAVTGISLNDHLLDVLFTLFDDNNDGDLSRAEFVTILKSRNARGLSKPRELGFARFVNAVSVCASKVVKQKINGTTVA